MIGIRVGYFSLSCIVIRWARREEASLGCAPGEAALGCAPGLGDRKGVPRWLVHIAGEANQTVGIGTAGSWCSEAAWTWSSVLRGLLASGDFHKTEEGEEVVGPSSRIG